MVCRSVFVRAFPGILSARHGPGNFPSFTTMATRAWRRYSRMPFPASLLSSPWRMHTAELGTDIHERRAPLLRELHALWLSLSSYFFRTLSGNTSEEMQTCPVAKHRLPFSRQLSEAFGLSPSRKNTWKTSAQVVTKAGWTHQQSDSQEQKSPAVCGTSAPLTRKKRLLLLPKGGKKTSEILTH